jgi:hypothetical protein
VFQNLTRQTVNNLFCYLFENAHVCKSYNKKVCGGSAPTPPAETVVSALCAGILSTHIRVFASLFAKSEQVSGRHPEKLKKRKSVWQTLYIRALKKSNTKNFYIVNAYL